MPLSVRRADGFESAAGFPAPSGAAHLLSPSTYFTDVSLRHLPIRMTIWERGKSLFYNFRHHLGNALLLLLFFFLPCTRKQNMPKGLIYKNQLHCVLLLFLKFVGIPFRIINTGFSPMFFSEETVQLK